jgi:hypothetical protein
LNWKSFSKLDFDAKEGESFNPRATVYESAYGADEDECEGYEVS